MRVSVGSENPVKIAAVEDALAGMAGVTVDGEPIDSGVSEQPRGREETIEGATRRAERALAAGAYDLGVGIEGGVREDDALPGLYLIMWAAVTDGTRTTHGSGPAIRLPDSIARRVEAGEELGPAIDAALGTDEIGRNEGAAGVLTDDVIDRRSSLTHAVAAALGPFVTPHYDL